MKEKLGRILKGNFYVAAVIALVGTVSGFLLCTMFLMENIILMLAPLWLFVIFAVMYFVLDFIPQISGKWYVKLGVMAAVAVVLAALLILLG